jgi:hypothetical protein
MSTPTAPPVSEPSDTRSLSYAAFAVIAVLGWGRLFDFSILTGTVILVDQDPYVGSAFAILAYVVVVVLLVRRHSIEPPQKDPTFTS